MAVMDLAASQRGCWRKIAITLIDMIVSGIVTLDGAKNEYYKLAARPRIKTGVFVQPSLDGEGPGFLSQSTAKRNLSGCWR